MIRSSRLFWGVFFLHLGALLLLERLYIIFLPRDLGLIVWPLVLVGFGVAAIAWNSIVRIIGIVIAALALGFAVNSLLSFFWADEDVFVNNDSLQHQQFSEAYRHDIQRAGLDVDVRAGSIDVTGETDRLFEAATRSTMGGYTFEASDADGRRELRLSMGERRWYPLKNMRNTLNVQLNRHPTWDLRFDVGTAHLDADLSVFKTESVHIDAGAAQVHLRLGANVSESRVQIDAGAASVTMEVPENAGCEIRLDAGLSRKRFPGFRKIETGLYRTENFEGAQRTILVSFDAGASSLRVERY